jgi:diacylglycerol kinase family enzyme
VLLINPRSGDGKAERVGLVSAARDRGIRPELLTPGADLAGLATDAVREGADALGMAGGDGCRHWWRQSPPDSMCRWCVFLRALATTSPLI